MAVAKTAKSKTINTRSSNPKSKKLVFGWRARLRDKRYIAGGVAILLFAAVGSYLLFSSKAATGPGLYYNSLTPTRIADTRPGSGQPYAGQTVGPNSSLQIQVTGRAGVPSIPAYTTSSVVVNITAVAPSADTYIAAQNSGTSPVTSSNMNVKAGQVANTQATVQLSSDGIMRLYNNAGYTNIIVDVIGYYSTSGDRMISTTPTRIMDTRAGSGKAYSAQTLAPYSKLNVQFRGIRDVNLPSNNVATGAVVAVTVVSPSANGYLTLYSSGTDQPGTSSLNYNAGQILTKEVNVKLGSDGGFTIANNSAGSVEIIADIDGYFVPESVVGGELFQPSGPSRLIDTRNGSGKTGAGNHITAGGVLNVKTGLQTIPAGATGVIYNLTALNSTGNSYLTTYPSGTSRPGTSSLNISPGQTAFSQVTTKQGTDSSFNIYNAAGTTDVIVDVVGYSYANYNKLSFYTNYCYEGTGAYTTTGFTITNCIARGSSTTVAPSTTPCPEGFYSNRNGNCRDENGYPLAQYFISSLNSGAYNCTYATVPPTLREGNSGECVKAVQFGLNSWNTYYKYGQPLMAVDGSFNAQTTTAVKSYQTKKGLTADGVVAPSTWNAFSNDCAVYSVPGSYDLCHPTGGK